MSDRKRNKPCAAQTAMPLEAAPSPLAEDNPVQTLLAALYKLALDGNVTAAKLYLDYTARQRGEEPVGLTAEEALLLLREQQTPGAAP